MKTYHGSCHCGAVRFDADIDLAAGTLRCNCSYCQKIRCWVAAVPIDAFCLTAGEQALTYYQFGARREHHYFCRHCGVRVFGRAQSARRGPVYGISISCLDDATAAELAAAPVTWIDGKNDQWDTPPEQVQHL